MLNKYTSALGVTAMLALAACRYTPSTVPMEGSPRDIARLAGTWDGEYSSVASGRTGSITFTIAAGKDTALGDVVMIPEHGQPLHAADAETWKHREHARSSELLRVTLIRVDGGVLRGELEPYIAPDCQCHVTTVFRGGLNGDKIDGQYVTRAAGGLVQEGRWSVTRRKK
jgi:hypothetical protein